MESSNIAAQNINTITESVINNLFRNLKALFPANAVAWSDQQVLNDAKKQWLLAFNEQQINKVESLKQGLKICRGLKQVFIPSVGQFIDFCKPDVASLGAPTYIKAYDEAVRRSHPSATGETWSHPAVYHAWFETGSRALNMATGDFQIKEMRNLFYSNYDLTLKMLANGEKLRELPKLLTEQQEKIVVTEEGTAILHALKNLNKTKSEEL